MELYIDDASISEIERLYSIYPVDGVTTNPHILVKTDCDPRTVLSRIRSAIKDDLLFVQTTSMDANGMIREAHRIIRLLGERTVVKIPVVREGIQAITQLKREGIKTCGTIVYSPMQVFLAAKVGADYIAPYINRIDNLGINGINAVKEMQDIIRQNGFSSKLLGASFHNCYQVQELCRIGIDACTLSPSIFDSLLGNPAVESAMEAFQDEYLSAFGTGNCLFDE